MEGLAARIATLQRRIAVACERAGRNPEGVELLPVSKRQPVALLREAMDLGFTRFGENYVQEGTRKAQALPGAAFVLIGPLQRNKARPALENFREIMTLDRPELGGRILSLAEELALVRPLWIQVDLWQEATKVGGCSPEGILPVLQSLSADPRTPLVGFMAIPPPDRPEAFAQLGALRREWEQRLGRPLKLSMGMSGDLEEAIRWGSDQVRVGTAFFGERPGPLGA
ncbi:MAG: YggS family pyridoxal phosphate-dependent enzyme [Acidobacteria bacterium]|nr:YggS family pyridoxal phosphate-dependent enzyme [Acidobacteriota bacterium]